MSLSGSIELHDMYTYSTAQIELPARVVRQRVLLNTQARALFECTRVQETHVVLHTRDKQ